MFWTPIFCSRSALLMRLAAALKLATSACVIRRRWCLFLFFYGHELADLTWSKTLVSPCVPRKFWFLRVPWYVGGTFPPKFLGNRGGRSTSRSPPHVSFAYIGESIGRLPPGLIRATYGDANPRLPDLRGDVAGATSGLSRRNSAILSRMGMST